MASDVGCKAEQSKSTDQHYDYFLVLDFEATCDNISNLEPQVRRYSYFLINLIFLNFY